MNHQYIYHFTTKSYMPKSDTTRVKAEDNPIVKAVTAFEAGRVFSMQEFTEKRFIAAARSAVVRLGLCEQLRAGMYRRR